MSLDKWEVKFQDAIKKASLEPIEWDKVDKDKTVKQAVRKEIGTAKRETQQLIRNNVPNTSTQTWKGVKSAVYKAVIGGNISILQSRGVYRNMNIYNRQHKRYTSDRTKEVESYFGPSRSFILRFLVLGTGDRTAGTRYSSRGGSGFRGSITAGRWFRPSAETAMDKAADHISEIITAIVEKKFKEG